MCGGAYCLEMSCSITFPPTQLRAGLSCQSQCFTLTKLIGQMNTPQNLPQQKLSLAKSIGQLITWGQSRLNFFWGGASCRPSLYRVKPSGPSFLPSFPTLRVNGLPPLRTRKRGRSGNSPPAIFETHLHNTHLAQGAGAGGPSVGFRFL